MNNNDMEKVFSSIYKNCSWGSNGHSKYHGSSGDGSSPEYNVDYIEFVRNFIKDNNIKSVSDGGCGDWRLGYSLFNDMNIEYNGYDVYLELIDFLKTEYTNPKFNFTHLDIFNDRDQIKDADLFIIKDVMQHWDDATTKEFVDWIINTKKFKFVLITNCSSGRVGMTQEGLTGGWRGLSCDHYIFKNKGFLPVLKYHTKEVMLYQYNNNTMKEIYKLISNFKIDKKYWGYTNLSSEDYSNRSKPGPYVKLTIKIAKMLGLKNVVEIGSTRFAVSNKCIEYYNKDNEPFDSPPCCTDGHCGFFFGEEGFKVNTVDIDTNCETQIRWSYNNLGRELPDNIKINIPKDGIEFLNEFEERIDVLFLDGWDVGTLDYGEKHLEAFLAAENKLSDVHLILIDDTDFSISNGGKDHLLTPFLIDKGYIQLFNGRQTLFLNTTNITTFEMNNDEINLELTEFPKVILSLSTTPNRLSEIRDGWGIKQPIEKLLNLSYPNYEIHFNIPYINHKTSEEYVIPEWLINYSLNNDKLKIFRCNDYGSITKIVPTILRVDEPETTIITVDDDLIYEDGFIEYHIKKQKIHPDSALGFAGIGAYDGSCHLCTTLNKDTKIKILEGYKTVSYKRKFFNDDFLTDFVGKSWNDDLCISAYLGKHKIPKIVMNYNKDDNFNARVESFPIVKVMSNEYSGCYLYRLSLIHI